MHRTKHSGMLNISLNAIRYNPAATATGYNTNSPDDGIGAEQFFTLIPFDATVQCAPSSPDTIIIRVRNPRAKWTRVWLRPRGTPVIEWRRSAPIRLEGLHKRHKRLILQSV